MATQISKAIALFLPEHIPALFAADLGPAPCSSELLPRHLHAHQHVSFLKQTERSRKVVRTRA